MNNLLWVAINLIGIVILAFMYTYIGKTGNGKKPENKPFMFLQAAIISFLVFDSGIYLIDGNIFFASVTINYLFSTLYYLSLPIVGFSYFIYCGYCVNAGDHMSMKKAVLYCIPVFLNIIAVIITPFTNLLFFINEGNFYSRGDYFWITFLITLLYVLSAYIHLITKVVFKKSKAIKATDIYLFLFPVLPVFFGVLQVLYYGTALTGIGFVISSLVMYIRSIAHSEEKHNLSIRFFAISIAQFGTVFVIMIVGLFLTLDSAIDNISEDYAAYNSINTANTIKIYLSKEISVLGTTVKSGALIDWFENEDDPELKARAHDELFKSIDVLYNNNLFIVIENSQQGFVVTGGDLPENISQYMPISKDNQVDRWYFDLKEQPQAYFLDVDAYEGKRAVWLNYKVINENGEFVGALSTNMDISGLTEQAVAQYKDSNTRVLIVDRCGQVHVDSNYIDAEEFLVHGANRNIKNEIPDPGFLEAVNAHLESIDGYFDEYNVESEIFKLRQGPHHYATITPIGMTDWTVIKFFDSTSLFAMSRLLPPFIVITVLFVLFVFTSNNELRRLIFKPLQQLVDSLVSMRGSRDRGIYGMDRDDELGLLSNTIHDLFIVGHFDALTGIYNRRYMETTLAQIIAVQSRADSSLGLLMMDIDNFKKYNDTYGHAAGDECLKAVAGALESVVRREGDFVARYGGEEFIAALPNTDPAGAVLVAESILKAVIDLKIPHEKNTGGIVTISIGVVTDKCSDGKTWSDFVKMADEALYVSKDKGRNRYTVY